MAGHVSYEAVALGICPLEHILILNSLMDHQLANEQAAARKMQQSGV